MAIVVFEGSNKVGKTTLINEFIKLCEANGFKYKNFNERIVRNAEKKITAIEMYEKACEDFAEMLKQDRENIVVVDRFHITELVYGRIYRGYENYYMEMVDALLATAGAKLVYMVSDYEHIEDYFEKWKLLKIQEDILKTRVNTGMKYIEIKLKNVTNEELACKAEQVLNLVLGE